MPSERDIFDMLFFGEESMDEDELFQKIFALGLFSYKKWDRLISWEEENGKNISDFQRCNFADSFTKAEIKEIRKAASDTVKDIKIGRNKFMYGVFQSVAGWILVSIGLVTVFFIYNYAGYDVAQLVREINNN